MSRLIDADALLVKVAHRNALDVIPGADFERIWIYSMVQNDMFNTVKAAPTIDTVPVVHAYWVRASGKSHIWYCSACGDKINYKQNCSTYNIRKVPVEQKNRFCRNCGAKMDGGAESV